MLNYFFTKLDYSILCKTFSKCGYTSDVLFSGNSGKMLFPSPLEIYCTPELWLQGKCPCPFIMSIPILQTKLHTAMTEESLFMQSSQFTPSKKGSRHTSNSSTHLLRKNKETIILICQLALLHDITNTCV